MATRTPPRYVPTLTEVVGAGVPSRPRRLRPALSQEQLIQRVMQRVDLALERRLREAVAAAVLEQTRAIGALAARGNRAVVRETVAAGLRARNCRRDADRA